MALSGGALDGGLGWQENWGCEETPTLAPLCLETASSLHLRPAEPDASRVLRSPGACVPLEVSGSATRVEGQKSSREGERTAEPTRRTQRAHSHTPRQTTRTVLCHFRWGLCSVSACPGAWPFIRLIEQFTELMAPAQGSPGCWQQGQRLARPSEGLAWSPQIWHRAATCPRMGRGLLASCPVSRLVAQQALLHPLFL